MKSSKFIRAFTLIELLVVLGIIAILMGILLPAFATAKTRAKIAVAKMEIACLKSAIGGYMAEYSRPPVSRDAERSVTDTCPDFTYGARVDNLFIGNVGNSGYQASNDEVISILIDADRGANQGHVRNPNRHAFFNAKYVADNRSPGIGLDGVLRDPWGNPYIITVDLNDDNKCLDGFYYGLLKPGEVPAAAIVWSLGPDGKANATRSVGARGKENKDNILSW